MKFKTTAVTTPMSLYVPVSRLNTGDQRERFDTLKAGIAAIAGGYSVSQVYGGWVMDDGSLCEEQVLKLDVCVLQPFNAEQEKAARKQAHEIGLLFQGYAEFLIEQGEEAVFTTSAQGGIILSRMSEEEEQALIQQAQAQQVGDTKVTPINGQAGEPANEEAAQ